MDFIRKTPEIIASLFFQLNLHLDDAWPQGQVYVFHEQLK